MFFQNSNVIISPAAVPEGSSFSTSFSTLVTLCFIVLFCFVIASAAEGLWEWHSILLSLYLYCRLCDLYVGFYRVGKQKTLLSIHPSELGNQPYPR